MVTFLIFVLVTDPSSSTYITSSVM